MRNPHDARRVLQCYRTACKRPAHPCGYNRSTHGIYCLQCAKEIEANPVPYQAHRDGLDDPFPLFPLLARWGFQWNGSTHLAGGSLDAGLIVVRPSKVTIHTERGKHDDRRRQHEQERP